MEKITKTVNIDFIAEIKQSSIDSLKNLINTFQEFSKLAPDKDFVALNGALNVMSIALDKIGKSDSLKDIVEAIQKSASQAKTAKKEINDYYNATKKGASESTEELKTLYEEQKKYDNSIKETEQRIRKLEKTRTHMQTGGDLRNYAIKELKVGSNNKVFSRISENYNTVELEKFIELTKERLKLLSKEPEKETKKAKTTRETEIATINKLLEGIKERNKKEKELNNTLDKQEEKLISIKRLRDGINSQINIAEASPENSNMAEGLNKVNKALTDQEEQLKKVRSAKVANDLKNSDKKIGEVKAEVEGLTKSMIASTLAVNLLKQAYRQTISTITELDAAFNGIAIVSQYSTKQVWGMYDAFEGIALRSGLTVKSISQVALEFFRQGRSLTDSLRLTEAAATAAQIAGIDAAESVRYLTSAIQGYKLSADQAMVVSDKFAALAAASATDYDGLATALSKVAAQANAVGVNMDSMMGFIAKALETTQEAPENIGTA